MSRAIFLGYWVNILGRVGAVYSLIINSTHIIKWQLHSLIRKVDAWHVVEDVLAQDKHWLTIQRILLCGHRAADPDF